MWAVQYHRYGDPSVLETEEVAAGILRPVVDRTYAVTDLARAHEEFGKGGTAGSRLICHTMP